MNHIPATCAVLLALAFPSSLNAGRVSDIPRKRQTILRKDWQPTFEQTQKALRQVQRFLENPTPDYRSDPDVMRDIAEALLHSKEYHIQFIGVKIKRRTFIKCSFIILGNPPWAKDWRTKEAWMDDGRYHMWRIFYEPSPDKCVGFRMNGDA